MELSLLSDITQILQTYGINSGISILLIIVLLSILKSKWVGILLSRISDIFIEKFLKNKTKNVTQNLRIITESDITNHDIFNYINGKKYKAVNISKTFKFIKDNIKDIIYKYYSYVNQLFSIFSHIRGSADVIKHLEPYKNLKNETVQTAMITPVTHVNSRGRLKPPVK